MAQPVVKSISWTQTEPFWKKLWPSTPRIEPISTMTMGGGYNPQFKSHPVFFLGLFLEEELVGVNSCFPTVEEEFRSRGLYVEPAFRSHGYGQLLLEKTCELAQEKGAKKIWSAPRVSAMPSYQKSGFVFFGSPTNVGFAYGPNYYVYRSLLR